MAKLAEHISRAIRSGPVLPGRYNLFCFRSKPLDKLSLGESVCRFIEDYLRIPEGTAAGQPFRLEDFQVVFILSVFGFRLADPQAERAFLSVARKNGKTGLIAGIVLAVLVGPLAQVNAQIVSGAMSREQAALVFRAAVKMTELTPEIADIVRVVPSKKQIFGLPMGTEYVALAADGATAQGLSPLVAIIDEAGQVRGASSPFVEAILTSQGAHDNPLAIIISTQAASDADFLSIQIDDATRSPSPRVVCHVYEASAECDLLDEKEWRFANPGLGKFRSKRDLQSQLEQASRLPAIEPSKRNLLLNQRVAQHAVFISPTVWKDNRAPINRDLFYEYPVHLGLDLSARTDLTAAVLAVLDPHTEHVHLWPFVFTPAETIGERELRDKAPYRGWVNDGHLIAVPGKTVNYDFVCDFLLSACEGMAVESLNFDRWGIHHFRQAAERTGLDAAIGEWLEVGQGFRDMAPRLSAFEEALLNGKIHHGEHPLLNSAASNAIVTSDPSGNRKLDKPKATQRIDPLIAAIMAAFPCTDGREAAGFDVSAMIG